MLATRQSYTPNVRPSSLPLISLRLFRCGNALTVRNLNRDVNAGFVGDGVGAVQDPEFAVRWEDAERDAQGSAHCVLQDGRAQGDPDEHQVWQRRVEPHIHQSRRQVRWQPPPPFPPNRTLSNHHHSMDLLWNFVAKSQAYDCVHRLGQEKDVFVKRLVVENMIEERMLHLQDVKTGAHLPPFLFFLPRSINQWTAVLV